MIKSLKFSHKILLAAALVVIATFSLFTLYNDSLQRASIREDLEDYLHEMGEITASNVQNWLSGRILLIENLAQTLARDHSPETTQALLEQPLLGSTFLFTYLGQTDGTYTARPTSDLPADYDPRRRPWYNAATSAGQTTLTEPYMEPAIHELVLTIASPARQGGQPFGVVGGDLSLQTVVKIINSLDFGGMGYAFLVSGDGKILVHPDKDQVMKSLSDVYPRNTPKIGSGFSEAELHGNTRILSFSPVKGLSGLDWYIGISVDKDKAYAMLTKLRTSAIVAALIAVVAIVLLLGMLIRVLMQPLTDMGRAMQDIAQGEGDLTKRLKVTSNDEFGTLANAFNRFVERIHESIREVAGTARQLHDVAQLVVNASNSSMANSDEQSNRTNSVAAAINELGAAAQEIARNAADASHHASDANHQAEDGKQVVEQTIRAMNELSEKISASCANIEALNSRTVNIGQILEVIKGISEQTNLLALNAAIEAARAGEAGRGFAVVADEVRNLAHRAQESAQQIQKMIEELQIGAQEAVS
ncbi:TPA: methyl-accepting chemotaxis protein PctB, partial [Pseudomonas aeruginosa]|nr:methyl-accepting chemotaxis protein PctB [Pseudomonas aeruginosa]